MENRRKLSDAYDEMSRYLKELSAIENLLSDSKGQLAGNWTPGVSLILEDIHDKLFAIAEDIGEIGGIS